MPLSAFDVFACVIPANAGHRSGLDALAIETSSGRMLVASGLSADLRSQGVVQALPGSIVTPEAKVVVNALPVREFLGQHAPLNATDDYIEDGIDDLAHIKFAWSASGFGRGEQIFDKMPLAVGQVRRIGF